MRPPSCNCAVVGGLQLLISVCLARRHQAQPRLSSRPPVSQGSFTLSPVTDKLGAWTSIIGGLAGIGAVQTILAFAPITDTWALAALYGMFLLQRHSCAGAATRL